MARPAGLTASTADIRRRGGLKHAMGARSGHALRCGSSCGGPRPHRGRDQGRAGPGQLLGEFTAKVHTMTGQPHVDYGVRQAAYDLRKTRGKQLIRSPAGPAATTSQPTPPVSSPPSSPSASTSSPRSSPGSAAPPRPQTGPLDPRRPRLRNPPRQHAHPLRPPPHRHPRCSRIDNFSSIRFGKRLELFIQWEILAPRFVEGRNSHWESACAPYLIDTAMWGRWCARPKAGTGP